MQLAKTIKFFHTRSQISYSSYHGRFDIPDYRRRILHIIGTMLKRLLTIRECGFRFLLVNLVVLFSSILFYNCILH